MVNKHGLPSAFQELGIGERLTAFAQFMAVGSSEALPCLRDIDLMQVPRLVPYTWEFDFRDGRETGVRFRRSGTRIDDIYRTNLTGKTFAETYSGGHQSEVEAFYWRVCDEKRPGLSVRYDLYHNPDCGYDSEVMQSRRVESLFFPCSTNGTCVDFGMGISEWIFDPEAEIQPNEFRLIG